MNEKMKNQKELIIIVSNHEFERISKEYFNVDGHVLNWRYYFLLYHSIYF